MKSKLKQILFTLKEFVIKILIIRVSSVKNFVIFAVIYGVLNFSIRALILKNFSDDFNVWILYWIFTAISISSVISILIFILRRRYGHLLQLVISRWIDWDRIEGNRIKEEKVEQLAFQKTGVEFKNREAILIFIVFVNLIGYRSHQPVLVFFSAIGFFGTLTKQENFTRLCKA